MTRGTESATRYSGPYRRQWLPERPPAFQAMYCTRLERAARVMPKLMEWANDFAPADAVIPRTPASRSGQHQLPTANRTVSIVCKKVENSHGRPQRSCRSDGVSGFQASLLVPRR